MGLYSRLAAPDSKPYARWWWLSGPFSETDIARQLAWVSENGFGGVELAWLFPAWLEEDETDCDRPLWLGSRWSELVFFTKQRAGELGLGCDFTFGSAWPFGGSWLEKEDVSQTFFGPSPQRIGAAWERPQKGAVPVLNHLSARALQRYASPLLTALRPALGAAAPSALFCDSLELETGELWSPELWPRFEERFGYDLRPSATEIGELPDVRYDYRKFLGDTILREFYQEFAALCHENGALSRVQCHGAPTDLLAAYAAVDIPESEALLFPPPFSRIAASAAAWAGRPLVSAEAFTCIYGFPGREALADELWNLEDARDLKLLADSLFAHGVNGLVWHGMPYQPLAKEVEFYASVHLAPDSALAPHLPELNRYFAEVCSLLRIGESYCGMGVYLPWEDALMEDELPEALQTPGAQYVWEMRYAAIPPELHGFAPLWISEPFLRDARCQNGLICSGKLRVPAIYFDCEWLDFESLAHVARLLDEGGTIIWKRKPREPGRIKHPGYEPGCTGIAERASATLTEAAVIPLVSGESTPPFWARRVEDDLLLFFPHPLAHSIWYPMPYQFAARAAEPLTSELVISWAAKAIPVRLHFAPYQSAMLRVSESGAEQLAIGWKYQPPTA